MSNPETLAEQYASLGEFHTATAMEAVDEMLQELGQEVSIAMRESLRAKIQECLEPLIDQDFVELVGSAAMN